MKLYNCEVSWLIEGKERTDLYLVREPTKEQALRQTQCLFKQDQPNVKDARFEVVKTESKHDKHA